MDFSVAFFPATPVTLCAIGTITGTRNPRAKGFYMFRLLSECRFFTCPGKFVPFGLFSAGHWKWRSPKSRHFSHLSRALQVPFCVCNIYSGFELYVFYVGGRALAPFIVPLLFLVRRLACIFIVQWYLFIP